MIKLTAKEDIYIKMELSILVTEKMIYKMVMEKKYELMVVNIMVIIKMEKRMEKEYICGLINLHIKVIGILMNYVDLVNMYGKMEEYFLGNEKIIL